MSGTQIVTREEVRSSSDGDAIAVIEDTATWGTWKTHGNAGKLYYWGRQRASANEQDGRLLTFSMEKSSLTGRDAQGKVVMHGGNATRFWASPVATPQPVTRDEADKILSATPDADLEDKLSTIMVKISPAKLHSKFCACGCRTAVTRRALYRQGHDAKHVAKLFREIALHRIEIEGALEILPTAALREKLATQIRRSIAKS